MYTLSKSYITTADLKVVMQYHLTMDKEVNKEITSFYILKTSRVRMPCILMPIRSKQLFMAQLSL